MKSALRFVIFAIAAMCASLAHAQTCTQTYGEWVFRPLTPSGADTVPRQYTTDARNLALAAGKVLGGVTGGIVFQSVTTTCPPKVGQALLTWAPPTMNEDGTPLDDLWAYEVQFWQDPAKVQTQGVAGLLTTTVVPNLAAGTWQFTLVAIDKDGHRSKPSNALAKVIQ